MLARRNLGFVLSVESRFFEKLYVIQATAEDNHDLKNSYDTNCSGIVSHIHFGCFQTAIASTLAMPIHTICKVVAVTRTNATNATNAIASINNSKDSQ